MSQFRTRENAVYRANDAVKQLTTRGIDLPDTVAGAVDTLTRVRNSRPAPPAQTAMRDLILAGAEQPEIDKALLADLGFTRLDQEWQQATINAAGLVLRAIRDEHDAIYPQLKTLADAQIEHVEAVAKLDGESLQSLVVAGRHDDAQKLAEVDVAAAELNALHDLYSDYLVDAHHDLVVDGIDCTRWRDPRPVNHHSGGYAQSITGHTLGGLRVGGELWFPTAAEAIEAAELVARDNAAIARRLAAERDPQGAAAPRSGTFVGA